MNFSIIGGFLSTVFKKQLTTLAGLGASIWKWMISDIRNFVIVILSFLCIILYIRGSFSLKDQENQNKYMDGSLLAAKVVKNNFVDGILGKTVMPVPDSLKGNVKQVIKLTPKQGDPIYVYVTKDNEVYVKDSSGTIATVEVENQGIKTAEWSPGVRLGFIVEHSSPKLAASIEIYRYKSFYAGITGNANFVGGDISYRLPYKLLSNTYVSVGSGVNLKDGYRSMYAGVSVKF